MTQLLIGVMALIAVVVVLNASNRKQIRKMQAQINELCRAVGHDELVVIDISDEDKELLLHMKNTGKGAEALKKIMDITGLDEKGAQKYFERI